MENLIKLHKAQLASDRMSCHSAIANQVRLVFHTAVCAPHALQQMQRRFKSEVQQCSIDGMAE
jgi:hypothetical protein